MGVQSDPGKCGSFILLAFMALQFWKPGSSGPGSTLDRASELEGSIIQSAPSELSISSARERLPVFKHRNELLHWNLVFLIS